MHHSSWLVIYADVRLLHLISLLCWFLRKVDLGYRLVDSYPQQEETKNSDLTASLPTAEAKVGSLGVPVSGYLASQVCFL